MKIHFTAKLTKLAKRIKNGSNHGFLFVLKIISTFLASFVSFAVKNPFGGVV